jgi:hypothetical protein
VGVAEEMRFVAMRLRNPKKTTLKDNTGAAEDDGSEDDDQEVKEDNSELEEEDEEEEDNHQVAEEGDAEVEGEWMPSIEGFVRYLVDSKLVFDTVERVVAGSTDVACECEFSFSILSTVLLSWRLYSTRSSSPKRQCHGWLHLEFRPRNWICSLQIKSMIYNVHWPSTNIKCLM